MRVADPSLSHARGNKFSSFLLQSLTFLVSLPGRHPAALGKNPVWKLSPLCAVLFPVPGKSFSTRFFFPSLLSRQRGLCCLATLPCRVFERNRRLFRLGVVPVIFFLPPPMSNTPQNPCLSSLFLNLSRITLPSRRPFSFFLDHSACLSADGVRD